MVAIWRLSLIVPLPTYTYIPLLISSCVQNVPKMWLRKLAVNPIKRDFYYNAQSIKENSFSAEDIFPPETLMNFKNQSLFFIKEFQSIFFGSCYTICYLKKISQMKYFSIKLKRNLSFNIYFHAKGEEIWINSKINFIPIQSFHVDTSMSNGMLAAEFSINELEFKAASLEGVRCR